jgi:hypothetical protein
LQENARRGQAGWIAVVAWVEKKVDANDFIYLTWALLGTKAFRAEACG